MPDVIINPLESQMELFLLQYNLNPLESFWYCTRVSLRVIPFTFSR